MRFLLSHIPEMAYFSDPTQIIGASCSDERALASPLEALVMIQTLLNSCRPGAARTGPPRPGQCLLLVTAFVVWFSGCQSVFLTGRQQLDILPEKQEVALGTKAYQEVLQTEPKSQNAHLEQMLDRVGQRIAAVSERPDFEWEFTLLSGPTQNAFCLPGGKVAVYEGILPVCANEAGLAVVMSHEIAHALARHGGERMTHQMAAEGGEWALGRIIGTGESKKVAIMKNVYGLGAQYGVLLPFSRTQEAEADSIGLLLMARAGYDPEEAPRFWERFSQTSGENLPELLSTHPSDEIRSAKLQEIVPRAMSVYQSASQRHGLGEQIPMQALAVVTPKPVVAPVEAAPATVAASAIAPATPPTPAAASVVPVAALASTAISAVTVAPAPIVQTTPVPASGTTPAPTDIAISLPNLGAPTVEGTPVAPSDSPVVTASASVESSAPAVVTAAHEVPAPVTPPGSTATEKPASPLDVAALPEASPPPVVEAASDWKPHVE